MRQTSCRLWLTLVSEQEAMLSLHVTLQQGKLMVQHQDKKVWGHLVTKLVSMQASRKVQSTVSWKQACKQKSK